MAMEVCVMPSGWTGLIEEGGPGFQPELNFMKYLYAAPNDGVWVRHRHESYFVQRGFISWVRYLPDIASPKYQSLGVIE